MVEYEWKKKRRNVSQFFRHFSRFDQGSDIENLRRMSCVEFFAQAALSKLPGQGKQAGNPVAILKVLGWKVN